jgi:hypothetical protein
MIDLQSALSVHCNSNGNMLCAFGISKGTLNILIIQFPLFIFCSVQRLRIWRTGWTVSVFVVPHHNCWLGFVQTAYSTCDVYVFRATVQYTRACTSNWLHSTYHLLLPHASASGYCDLEGATTFFSSLRMAISGGWNIWEQWIINTAQRIGSASLYYLFLCLRRASMTNTLLSNWCTMYKLYNCALVG